MYFLEINALRIEVIFMLIEWDLYEVVLLIETYDNIMNKKCDFDFECFKLSVLLNEYARKNSADI
jgi:phenylalanyl-tRNA synthetase beta subunit